MTKTIPTGIRPKDAEAFYYLGVALRRLGRETEARVALAKASWSAGWVCASHYELAELDCVRGDFESALSHLGLSLSADPAASRSRGLQASVLRKLGRMPEAEVVANKARVADPLDHRAAFELWLARRDSMNRSARREGWERFIVDLRRDLQAHLELATDYANAGMWSDAAALAESALPAVKPGATIYPLVYATLDFYAERQGTPRQTFEVLFRSDWPSSNDLTFPLRFEEEPILRECMKNHPQNAGPPYLLGCLLYDNQPENAITAWEESRKRDDKFALTHRNLALAYAQHEKNIPKAIASLEKAVELDPSEPRFFYELDVQYEAAGTPVAKRLEMLMKHHDVVAKRDDALTREIVLLTVAGQADRALELLRGRRFRNWEGSSQIHSVYVEACLTHGQKHAADKKPREGLAAYEAALEYPENLEVGRARRSPRTAQIQYLIGEAHEALGDAAEAKSAYEQAAAGRGGGSSESDYFRALALQKLDRTDEAKPIFERLVKAGEEQLTKGETADYFAKFGEKTSERVRQANAHYLIGLGQLGLKDAAKAKATFQQALELHPAHLGAVMHLANVARRF